MNQTSQNSERLIQDLYQQLQSHPHRDEVVSLALAQLLDAEDDHFDATVALEVL